MELKKLFLMIIAGCAFFGVSAQQQTKSTLPETKAQKKADRREKINQLIRQEEEGALIYQKQGAFGFKFNTDGWGMFYEHGKYKSITTTNLWWLELGEHKHPKEEKVPTLNASSNYLIISSYIYGKRNNFYDFKVGFGQQKLIGGKGNKNGVAVSAIYGGGLSLGYLKPYYVNVQDPGSGTTTDIKYNDSTRSKFLDPNLITGSAGFTKGFGQGTFTPGAYGRLALRFDYGRYNEFLSALEVGVNLEYYAKEMPIMVDNPAKQFFANGYIAIEFGKRK